MGFYVPAEVAGNTAAFGTFPPATCYTKVTITRVEDRGTTDSKGNYSFFVHVRFPDGSSTREIGSVPYDDKGKPTSALMALGEYERGNKIKVLVGKLKSIFLSAGIEDSYISENGMETDWLTDRTAYIEWLGRPEDVPRGTKGYGEIKAWMLKETFEALPDGAVPTDSRVFPWRKTGNAAPARKQAAAAPPRAAVAAPPPAAATAAPPPRPSAAKLPPPPPQ